MKAIKLCGECADYDFIRQAYFYDDCPLEDVPEEKHGRRIFEINNEGLEAIMWCSACKRVSGVRSDGMWLRTNYCPDCGAKMDLTEEAEK